MIAAGKYEGTSEEYRDSTGAGTHLNLLCSCEKHKELCGRFFNSSLNGIPGLDSKIKQLSLCSDNEKNNFESWLSISSQAEHMAYDLYFKNLQQILKITKIVPSEYLKEDSESLTGCQSYESWIHNDQLVWNILKGKHKQQVSLCPASFLYLNSSNSKVSPENNPDLYHLYSAAMKLSFSPEIAQTLYLPGASTSLSLLKPQGYTQAGWNYVEHQDNLSYDEGFKKTQIAWNKHSDVTLQQQGDINSWNLNLVSLRNLLLECVRSGDTSNLNQVLYGQLCSPEYLTDCCYPTEIPLITEYALKLLLSAYLNADAYMIANVHEYQKKQAQQKTQAGQTLSNRLKPVC